MDKNDPPLAVDTDAQHVYLLHRANAGLTYPLISFKPTGTLIIGDVSWPLDTTKDAVKNYPRHHALPFLRRPSYRTMSSGRQGALCSTRRCGRAAGFKTGD